LLDTPGALGVRAGRARLPVVSCGVRVVTGECLQPPDQGETLQQLISHAPGSLLAPSAVDVHTYQTPDGQIAPEATIKARVFRRIFAADAPLSLTRVVAASQRPDRALHADRPVRPARLDDDPVVVPGGRRRQGVGAANERFMAQRIHATPVEDKGASHVVMISRTASW
jgi:hypothetical protein